MPRVPPLCFTRKLLGRYILFASRMSYVRTYPRWGTDFLLVACSMSTGNRYVPKRKHSTAKQHNKNNKNETAIRKEKNVPVPSRVISFCLVGTPYTRSKRRRGKIEQKRFSLSLVRRPPLSRPSRSRFGPGRAFPPLCHSEPRRPPHVKPGAHRGPRSPARQSWCLECVALSDF